VVVGAVPEGVEDGLARRFAGDGVILEQRRVRLLLQWRVQSTDGDNESRGFLQCKSACRMLTLRLLSGVLGAPHHARAGERVPAKTDAVCVLDLTPLVLECLEVCHAVRAVRAVRVVRVLRGGGGYLVEGNEGAHNSVATGRGCASGGRAVLDKVEQ
jgi:hypothetical protein